MVSGGLAATGASRAERQPWMAVTTFLRSWWARDSVSGQPRPHPRAAPRPPRGARTALRDHPCGWRAGWPSRHGLSGTAFQDTFPSRPWVPLPSTCPVPPEGRHRPRGS